MNSKPSFLFINLVLPNLASTFSLACYMVHSLLISYIFSKFVSFHINADINSNNTSDLETAS